MSRSKLQARTVLRRNTHHNQKKWGQSRFFDRFRLQLRK